MLSTEAKVMGGIGLGTLVLLIIGVFLFSNKNPGSTPVTSVPSDSARVLVREGSHSIASSSARITVVEFGDYQCPACAAAYPVTRQMLADYAGRINFVFRNFPLPQHKNAVISAQAVEAAASQGRFWEMHDLLYERQKEWEQSPSPLDVFVKYAAELGMDTAVFTTDVTSGKFADIIRMDQADGNLLGVDATPTFFIDGTKLPGLPGYSEVKSLIDAALAK